MNLQPDQTMNSNVIDQKIAEAEASLINAFAAQEGEGDFPYDDEESEDDEAKPTKEE